MFKHIIKINALERKHIDGLKLVISDIFDCIESVEKSYSNRSHTEWPEVSRYSTF